MPEHPRKRKRPKPVPKKARSVSKWLHIQKVKFGDVVRAPAMGKPIKVKAGTVLIAQIPHHPQIYILGVYRQGMVTPTYRVKVNEKGYSVNSKRMLLGHHVGGVPLRMLLNKYQNVQECVELKLADGTSLIKKSTQPNK